MLWESDELEIVRKRGPYPRRSLYPAFAARSPAALARAFR